VDKMNNYGPDKEVYIVDENEPFTHAILMNTAMPQLSIPIKNVVGLAFEPPQFLLSSNTTTFVEYVKNNVNKYFIGNSEGLPDAFLESYSYMWHITPPRVISSKSNLCSIMVSDKMQAPGHQYRPSSVREILKSDLPIDIYGRGCRYYSNDSRLKGEFTNDEPYESYHFHICIENFQTSAYSSEKYTNALLWQTTPVYLGAFHTIFPELTIKLSGNISDDMILITNIITRPDSYKKYFTNEEILSKINLLQNLDIIFSE